MLLESLDLILVTKKAMVNVPLSILGTPKSALIGPLVLRHVNMAYDARFNIQVFQSQKIGVSHVVVLDINIWSVLLQVDSKIPNVSKHGKYTMRDVELLAGISATRETVIGAEVAVVVRPMALEHLQLMHLDLSHVSPAPPPKAHEERGKARGKATPI